MKAFKSILLPFRFEPGPSSVLKLAIWFATQLKSRVSLMCFGNPPDSDRELFESLGAPSAQEMVTIRRSQGEFAEESLKASEELSVGLIVIPSEVVQELPTILDAQTRSLIEKTPIPVLLVPRSYRGRFPWRSILVPMSGETRENPALKVAIDLGSEFQISVDIIHVAEDAEGKSQEPATISNVADQVHHEYPERIASFISEASPFSSVEEKRCIRGVSLLRGDISDEILKETQRREPDLIAIQWKGRFMEGHATTLKRLISAVECPILLAKPSPKPAFTLKVGKPLKVSPPLQLGNRLP